MHLIESFVPKIFFNFSFLKIGKLILKIELILNLTQISMTIDHARKNTKVSILYFIVEKRKIENFIIEYNYEYCNTHSEYYKISKHHNIVILYFETQFR